MPIDQWLPGPRKKIRASREGPNGSPRKVLLVLNPTLFAVRDGKGEVTDTISESMLRQAVAKYARVIVCPAFGWDSVQRFKEEVARLQLPVEVMDLAGNGSVKISEALRKMILELGGEIKHISNPREISHLNIEQYSLSSHIIIVRRDDWVKAGLELDKPLTFQDVSKQRAGRSFWK